MDASETLRVSVKPMERLLAQTSSVAAGTFSCAPHDPHFANSGPSSAYCFVFPRTHVSIRHAGSQPFLSSPAIATMYNEGQEYERRAISPRGDRCDWCAVSPALLEDVLRGVATHAGRGGHRLFRHSHVPTDNGTYLRQRHLFEQLERTRDSEPLHLEETVVHLLGTLLARAHGHHPPSQGDDGRRRRALVSDAKLLLARSLHRRVELREMAETLGCSVFHLCRTFRRLEGMTLHAYHRQLRLRLALERLADTGRTDKTTVALDLGFSSHSHFTAAFREAFGMAPSTFLSSIS